MDSDDNSQLPEKPVAYLDQNVLDLFVDGEYQAFFESLKSKLIVAYSDETLKEIKRSGYYSDKFLSVLEQLDAYHLKIVLEQPEFKETDQATLTRRCPFEAFEEYCQSTADYEGIEAPMEELLFKFSGGNKGISIKEIHDDQKTEFSELMNEMSKHVQEVAEEIPSLELLFEEYQEEMTTTLTNALDENERLMKENIEDELNWSGIKDFRESTELGPKELNNIKPPNVVKQIWEMYQERYPYQEMNMDIDMFLGLSKHNPIFPDRPYHKHQQVLSIYNVLNTLGYHPDSKVHKKRRFIAAMSDNSHASMASFCNVLLSRDEAFVKKVQAAYEYLDIQTLVQHVVVRMDNN